MLYATVHFSEASANARKAAIDTFYGSNAGAVWAHHRNLPDPADSTAPVLPSPRWCTNSSATILADVPLTSAEQAEGCYNETLGEGAATYTAADPTVSPDSWQF